MTRALVTQFALDLPIKRFFFVIVVLFRVSSSFSNKLIIPSIALTHSISIFNVLMAFLSFSISIILSLLSADFPRHCSIVFCFLFFAAAAKSFFKSVANYRFVLISGSAILSFKPRELRSIIEVP